MSDTLRDRIAAALLKEDQLRVCKLSTHDIRFMADAVIQELDTEFLDFGLWLSEELRGFQMNRIDLESCIKDWKGKNPDGNV